MPCLDHCSCYATELMANADGWGNQPYKDIFDILAVYRQWSEIPAEAIAAAEAEYGEHAIPLALKSALQDVLANSEKYHEPAANLLMKPDWANDLIKFRAVQLFSLHKLNGLLQHPPIQKFQTANSPLRFSADRGSTKS